MANGGEHGDNWGVGGFIHLMDFDALPSGARWRKTAGRRGVKVDTPLPHSSFYVAYVIMS